MGETKRWRLVVEPDGWEPRERKCTTAENAKTWAAAYFRRMGEPGCFKAATATIYDPLGKPYARTRKVAGGSWRLRWERL